MAVLEKSRILPWQKKPTSLSTPNSDPKAIHNDTSQELQGELLTMEPPDQSPSTAKEEMPTEETPDLPTSQSSSTLTDLEKGVEITDTAITSEMTSAPEGQNLQGSDKVVVIKPPTAGAYKM